MRSPRTQIAATIVGLALVASTGCINRVDPGSGAAERLTKPILTAEDYEKALDDPGNILKPATDLRLPEDAREGGTARLLLENSPGSLNWLTENTVEAVQIEELVHSSFARRDFSDPDRWVPGLAFKVTANDDHTVYTVHLRRGVYWQLPALDYRDEEHQWIRDGLREVTAEDAVLYYRLMQHPDVKVDSLKNYYEDLASVKVVDRYTFQVRWARPVHHSRAFTLLGAPVPRWLVTRTKSGEPIEIDALGEEINHHWIARHPTGTGPYRVVDFEPGKHVFLERNPGYFGPRPAIDRIEYHVERFADRRQQKLIDGELDLISVSDPGVRDRLVRRGNGKLKSEKVDMFSYYYVGWNADTVFFEDRRVRRAMTHAIDRDFIIEQVHHGLAADQTGPFYHDHPATDSSIQPIPYDLDRARELLEEAGWVDVDGDGIRERDVGGRMTDFSFRLVSFDAETTQVFLRRLRRDLRSIGVRMRIEAVDWLTMQQHMRERDYDAFTGGWGLSWSIDPYQIWHSSQADLVTGSNRVGFRNERADALIEKLRETIDEGRRIELLHEFHRLVHEEQPYTFLYAPQTMFVWNERLENVSFRKIRPQVYPVDWWIAGPAGEGAAPSDGE